MRATPHQIRRFAVGRSGSPRAGARSFRASARRRLRVARPRDGARQPSRRHRRRRPRRLLHGVCAGRERRESGRCSKPIASVWAVRARSPGILQGEAAPSFRELDARHGRRAARAMFEASRRAVLDLATTVRRLGIKAGVETHDALRILAAVQPRRESVRARSARAPRRRSRRRAAQGRGGVARSGHRARARRRAISRLGTGAIPIGWSIGFARGGGRARRARSSSARPCAASRSSAAASSSHRRRRARGGDRDRLHGRAHRPVSIAQTSRPLRRALRRAHRATARRRAEADRSRGARRHRHRRAAAPDSLDRGRSRADCRRRSAADAGSRPRQGPRAAHRPVDVRALASLSGHLRRHARSTAGTFRWRRPRTARCTPARTATIRAICSRGRPGTIPRRRFSPAAFFCGTSSGNRTKTTRTSRLLARVMSQGNEPMASTRGNLFRTDRTLQGGSAKASWRRRRSCASGSATLPAIRARRSCMTACSKCSIRTPAVGASPARDERGGARGGAHREDGTARGGAAPQRSPEGQCSVRRRGRRTAQRRAAHRRGSAQEVDACGRNCRYGGWRRFRLYGQSSNEPPCREPAPALSSAAIYFSFSAQFRPHRRLLHVSHPDSGSVWPWGSARSAFAQSQAINGTIEGTVVDDQGAVLPGVTVTVANLDTGDTRVVVTNESGLYRAPLLPLGTYRVSAELQGFKKFEQTGITISRGPHRGDRREAERRHAVGNDHRHRRRAARRQRTDRARAARSPKRRSRRCR